MLHKIESELRSCVRELGYLQMTAEEAAEAAVVKKKAKEASALAAANATFLKPTSKYLLDEMNKAENRTNPTLFAAFTLVLNYIRDHKG